MNANTLENRTEEKDWREMTIRERTEKGAVMFTSEWDETNQCWVSTLSSHSLLLLARQES